MFIPSHCFQSRVWRHLLALTTGALVIALATVQGEVPREAVKAANAAGLKLFAQAFPEGANGSLAPLSITTALAMLQAGAEGQTRLEMTTLLAGQSPEVIGAYPELLQALRVQPSENAEPAVRVAFSHSLWMQQGFPIAAPFQQYLTEHWGQSAQSVDFRQDLETSRRTIRAWYAAQDPLLSDVSVDGLSDQTKLYLATAASLEAPWFARFDSSEPGSFQVTPDQIVSCEYLRLTLPTGYWEQPGMKAVRIPFRKERFGMVLLVPESIEVRTRVEESLAAGVLPFELSAFTRQPVALQIAKFHHRVAGQDLRPALEACGVREVFTREAHLSGIGPNLTLDSIQYSNEFKLDEHGCRAVAATGLSVIIKAEATSFVTDRPFYYFVMDEVTGLVLFVGRVHDPSEDPNWNATSRGL
jgi:serine protease inhibitor